MNSNEMARRCQKMMEILWEPDPFFDAIASAGNNVLAIAEKAIPGGWNRDSIRTEPITKAIFEHYGHKYIGDQHVEES